MRAFVAVEVPPPANEARRGNAPDHLTLLFLGEVARERVEPIAEALRPVGAIAAPFDLTLEGVGAFPSPERPRVVWTGATEGSAELVTLANGVRAALAHEGDPTRREATFVPHLTLFLVRSPNDVRRAHELLTSRIPPPPARRFHVAEFMLKESELSPRGATHRTVRTFPLTGRAPAPT